MCKGTHYTSLVSKSQFKRTDTNWQVPNGLNTAINVSSTEYSSEYSIAQNYRNCNEKDYNHTTNTLHSISILNIAIPIQPWQKPHQPRRQPRQRVAGSIESAGSNRSSMTQKDGIQHHHHRSSRRPKMETGLIIRCIFYKVMMLDNIALVNYFD